MKELDDVFFANYTNQVSRSIWCMLIRKVLDVVETSLGANVNYCNTAEQVPEAERNNRFSRMYSSYIPSTSLSVPPKIDLKVLVMESTKCLNYFLPKGSVSNYYSP